MSNLDEQGKWDRDIPENPTPEEIDEILKEDGVGEVVVEKIGIKGSLSGCKFQVCYFEGNDQGEDIGIIIKTRGVDPTAPPWESYMIPVLENNRAEERGIVVGNDISLSQYNTLRKIAKKINPREAGTEFA